MTVRWLREADIDCVGIKELKAPNQCRCWGGGDQKPRGNLFTPSPYLTVEEAAAYCRVAVQAIYNHRREIERLPGLQRKLLFRRETLDKWLETRRKRR